MKLYSGSSLLALVINELARLAAAPVGVAADHIKQRVHIRWAGDSVTLTASDGRRAYIVTLLGEKAQAESDEAVFLVMPQDLSRYALHTIFLGDEGGVRIIGSYETHPFGHNFGETGEEYPMKLIENARAAMKWGFARDCDPSGSRRVQVNPLFINEALTFIHQLWYSYAMNGEMQHLGRVPEEVARPHVDIMMPARADVPICLESYFATATPAPFKFEAIIMPYHPTFPPMTNG